MSEHGHQDHYEIVTELWSRLRRADQQRVRAARRRALRVRRLRTVALAVLLLLLLAGAALGVKSLLFGTAAPTFSSSSTPGLGAIRPGSVRLAGLRVADPGHAGRPWALRIFSTTRGSGCYQVGRYFDGRLVALGINGAFGNDGRAHRLPVDREGCGGTDDVGHLRFTALSQIRDTSAALTGPRCLDPENARALRLAVPNAQNYLRQALRRHDAQAVRQGRRALRLAHGREARASGACPPVVG